MILPGHVITAKLASRLAGGDEKVAIAGSLFPDVVDKALNLLRLSPSGRLPAHSVTVGLASTALVWLLGLGQCPGRHWGRAWAAGYLLHLLADVEAGLPWLLYPVRYERMERVSVPMDWLFGGEEPVPNRTLIAEGLVVAAYVLWRKNQKQSTKGRVENEDSELGWRVHEKCAPPP